SGSLRILGEEHPVDVRVRVLADDFVATGDLADAPLRGAFGDDDMGVTGGDEAHRRTASSKASTSSSASNGSSETSMLSSTSEVDRAMISNRDSSFSEGRTRITL